MPDRAIYELLEAMKSGVASYRFCMAALTPEKVHMDFIQRLYFNWKFRDVFV